jgi:hypothetical protein
VPAETAPATKNTGLDRRNGWLKQFRQPSPIRDVAPKFVPEASAQSSRRTSQPLARVPGHQDRRLHAARACGKPLVVVHQGFIELETIHDLQPF